MIKFFFTRRGAGKFAVKLQRLLKVGVYLGNHPTSFLKGYTVLIEIQTGYVYWPPNHHWPDYLINKLYSRENLPCA